MNDVCESHSFIKFIYKCQFQNKLSHISQNYRVVFAVTGTSKKGCFRLNYNTNFADL